MKPLPRGVTLALKTVYVIHRRTFQPFIVEYKAARLDNVHRNAKAGTKPHHGARIRCDIRLIESEAHTSIIKTASRVRHPFAKHRRDFLGCDRFVQIIVHTGGKVLFGITAHRIRRQGDDWLCCSWDKTFRYMKQYATRRVTCDKNRTQSFPELDQQLRA